MIAFEKRTDGIVVARVKNSEATAEISLYGAHALSYKPTGQKDLLFLSEKSSFAPGKPIRGGIPVCFPWFGPHAKNPALPLHGFARLSQWTLSSVEEREGRSSITLALADTEETRKLWKAPFSLKLTFSVGKTLEMTLTVANTGRKPFVVSDALHTYFNVKNIDTISVIGLDKASFVDKTDDYRVVKQEGDVRVVETTDRVYMRPKAITLSDPGFRRGIRIEKKNFPNTVIWNPHAARCGTIADLKADDYRRMICVEAGAVLGDSITVEEGKSITQKMTIASEPYEK